MRFLVVEDDEQIKTQTIDDCLASLGCASDWATNQQEANELLAVHEYDLILLDLKILSRPGGEVSHQTTGPTYSSRSECARNGVFQSY